MSFASVFLEVQYLFRAALDRAVFTLFGLLALAFVLLVLVASLLAVALTFFQLAAQNWRWWWPAFLGGASTGLFLLAYATIFYLTSAMNGLLQTFMFFGNSLIIAYAFALMLGSVALLSSRAFVSYLYSSKRSLALLNDY